MSALCSVDQHFNLDILFFLFKSLLFHSFPAHGSFLLVAIAYFMILLKVNYVFLMGQIMKNKAKKKTPSKQTAKQSGKIISFNSTALWGMQRM